jgi:uncharacterized membrane protein
MKTEILAIAAGLLLSVGSISLKVFLNGGGPAALVPGAVFGAIGAVTFQFALRDGKAYLVNAIAFGSTAAAAALGGAFFLGEQLAQLEIMGIIVILAGVALATRY